MKKISFLLLFLISFTIHAQSNENPSGYYNSLFENYIKSANNLNNRIISEINNSYEQQFKEDLYKAKSYLKPLYEERWISLAEAEWRYKKANKMFNKSIRQYNSRVKKNQRKK